MKPLLWLPLRDVVRVESNVSVLTNGDFEGAAGPAGWSALTATGSRQAGQRTGGSGLYVGQAAYDGSHATGGLYQTTGVVGCPYHWVGWGRADGVSTAKPFLIDGIGNTFWLGAASNAWQSFDTIITNANTNMYLWAQTLAAGGWVQYDDTAAYPLKAYTKNLGSAGDVLVGDGLIPATMPTMLTPSVNVRRGMACTNTQSMKIPGGAIPNGTYTVVLCLNRTTSSTNRVFLFDSRGTGGVAGTGYLLTNNGTPSTLTTSSGTVYVNAQPSTTWDFGKVSTIIVAGITLSAPDYMILPGRFQGIESLNGNLYQAAIFPGTLSPVQVSMLHERLMSELSI